MVVVPTCAPEWISRCLDSGAQAIIVPHVNTVEQAKICVNASKFPPMVCSTLPEFLENFSAPNIRETQTNSNTGPPIRDNGDGHDTIYDPTLIQCYRGSCE